LLEICKLSRYIKLCINQSANIIKIDNDAKYIQKLLFEQKSRHIIKQRTLEIVIFFGLITEIKLVLKKIENFLKLSKTTLKRQRSLS